MMHAKEASLVRRLFPWGGLAVACLAALADLLGGGRLLATVPDGWLAVGSALLAAAWMYFLRPRDRATERLRAGVQALAAGAPLTRDGLATEDRAALDALAGRLDTLRGEAAQQAETLAEVRRVVSEVQARLDALASRNGVVETLEAALRQVGGELQEIAHAAGAIRERVREVNAADTAANVAMTEALGAMSSLSGRITEGSRAVGRLSEETQNIGTVLDVIRSIAEQTNLLALNAAIEAARAGEQGRGFAVVADEVRTLASRTQESTQEIQDMIEVLQQRARDAVGVIEKGGEQAEVVEGVVENAVVSIAEIGTHTEALEQLGQQIGELAARHGELSHRIEGTDTPAALCRELGQLAERLAVVCTPDPD